CRTITKTIDPSRDAWVRERRLRNQAPFLFWRNVAGKINQRLWDALEAWCINPATAQSGGSEAEKNRCESRLTNLSTLSSSRFSAYSLRGALEFLAFVFGNDMK